MLITYHYSKGDAHRGCAGFGYDTDAARSHTLEIKRQVEAVFGSGHDTVYPLVCGFETDEDALVLHGIGGEVLDLSTISPAMQDTLPAVLARLFPSMPHQMRQDLLPLVQGNLAHIAGVRQSNREPQNEHVEHHEWMLGIGRGFDWLHMPNLALIIGPYSPDLADPIRKAAGIIEANMKNYRIPDDGFLLLVASPYHEMGADRALAEVKSSFLSEFAAGLIRADCPHLKDKMHVRSAVINWQSQVMEVIDCPVARAPVSIPNKIERSAEMQARIYVADDEPLILNALVKRLSQGQHQVQGFKSGDELLSAVEQDVPDLIFLDVKMPGRTGIETLAAIRKKTQDAVVIMLTAYGTVDEAVEAMKLGAYDFLIKTLDLALVEPVVVRALEHASNRGRK
jgi:CheY-like chemotaxis protein